MAAHPGPDRRVVGLPDPLVRRLRARPRRRTWPSGPTLPQLAWWAAAGVLSLALLPLNVAVAVSMFDVAPVAAFGAGIGHSVALVLVLVRPAAATALQLLAVAALAVAIPVGTGPTWPLTGAGMGTLVVHVGLVAARAPRRDALTTWWATVVVLALVVQLGGREVLDWLAIVLVYLVLSAAVLSAVLAVRRWRAIRRELADARRDVEIEQGQRALAEERTRIARELHDVVAHSMSVIHMQATSAPYRIDGLGPEAEAEFARIAAGARTAMREMRSVLAVLRDDGADAQLSPVPDLRRLPELVESAGRAGVPVEVREADAVRAAVVPEPVALAAYRIVQESLSNVIRHAPGARTTVDLDLEGPDLVVTVVNAAPSRPAQAMEAPGRAGLGLAGMRERARLCGGSVETGPRPDGGHRVRARLPVGGRTIGGPAIGGQG